MADDLGKILGLIAGLVAFIFLGTFMVIIFSQLGDQQCQSYKDTINQKDTEIANLNIQINQINSLLDQCKTDYDELIKQNITKKDFEEIKAYYNLTQLEINNINQKFDQFNDNYNSYYSVLIKNYKISKAINISIGVSLFSVEVLSLIFLKSEFIWFVIKSIRKKREQTSKKEAP